MPVFMQLCFYIFCMYIYIIIMFIYNHPEIDRILDHIRCFNHIPIVKVRCQTWPVVSPIEFVDFFHQAFPSELNLHL